MGPSSLIIIIAVAIIRAIVGRVRPNPNLLRTIPHPLIPLSLLLTPLIPPIIPTLLLIHSLPITIPLTIPLLILHLPPNPPPPLLQASLTLSNWSSMTSFVSPTHSFPPYTFKRLSLHELSVMWLDAIFLSYSVDLLLLVLLYEQPSSSCYACFCLLDCYSQTCWFMCFHFLPLNCSSLSLMSVLRVKVSSLPILFT